MRGLVIGGTRSGCGKTTVTLALLAALRRRGLVVQSCKIGPDFIDPTHHTAITGRPSYNLDTWMGSEDSLRRILTTALHTSPTPDILIDKTGVDSVRRTLSTALHTSPVADILIIEGVMGLFDGAEGLGGPGSTAHTAQMLNLPVLLVTDARGMGQSTAAVAAGFVRARANIAYAGIVYTHVGSAQHAALVREGHAALFAPNEAPLLGVFPREGAPLLASRHLGLLLAHEQELDAEALADWCEESIDVNDLLTRCTPVSIAALISTPIPTHTVPQRENTISHLTPSAVPIPAHTASRLPAPCLRIAIARDMAFCFCYPDMERVLLEMGADILYFSPMVDTSLPVCDALYFPGGYPELYAQTLAANSALREAVRYFAATGGHMYAECGGYMYLMQTLHTDTASYPMCGCLPFECHIGQKRAALGYREVTLAQSGVSARGHEFHYARLSHTAGLDSTLAPLWQVRDRRGQPLPDEGVTCGTISASWIHLYPEGARAVLPYLFPGLRHAQDSIY